MTKIYSAPKEIEVPQLDWKNISKYKKDSEEYIQKLKEFLIKRKNEKYVGETINFPVADGYAQYMVASIKPLELVHINLGDGYQFQYVNRLTPKDIKEKIEQQKSLEKLFGG